MADNVNITPGSGKVIAADDVSDVYYQLVKLVDGTADSTTIIAVDVGAKANALRIAPANDITDGTYIGDIKFGEAETNSAAILADTTDIKTAIELLDNAVDGNYLNANLNIAGTDVSANAGVLTAQTLRVTIATDDEVNNLLGTIDADTGAIKLAVEIMDDWDDGDKCKVITQASTNTIEVVGDVAEDAAAAGNPLLSGGRYDTTPRELETGDVGAIAVSLDGGVVPGIHAAHWNVTIASADASSATQVKAAGAAGVRHYITSVVLSTDTAMNMQIQDDAGGPNIAIEDIHLAANGGMVYPIPAGSAIMMGADAQDIDVIASAAGNISVTMTGFSI